MTSIGMTSASLIPSLWFLLAGVAGGLVAFGFAYVVAELSARLPRPALTALLVLGVLGLAALTLSDPLVWGALSGLKWGGW